MTQTLGCRKGSDGFRMVKTLPGKSNGDVGLFYFYPLIYVSDDSVDGSLVFGASGASDVLVKQREWRRASTGALANPLLSQTGQIEQTT